MEEKSFTLEGLIPHEIKMRGLDFVEMVCPHCKSVVLPYDDSKISNPQVGTFYLEELRCPMCDNLSEYDCRLEMKLTVRGLRKPHIKDF